MPGGMGSPKGKRCVCIQWCLTLCDPMDCSPPDSFVHGILQARILEWVAMPFTRGSPQSKGSNLHVLCLLNCQAGYFTLAPHRKSHIYHLLPGFIKFCYFSFQIEFISCSVCLSLFNFLTQINIFKIHHPVSNGIISMFFIHSSIDKHIGFSISQLL